MSPAPISVPIKRHMHTTSSLKKSVSSIIAIDCVFEHIRLKNERRRLTDDNSCVMQPVDLIASEKKD